MICRICKVETVADIYIYILCVCVCVCVCVEGGGGRGWWGGGGGLEDSSACHSPGQRKGMRYLRSDLKIESSQRWKLERDESERQADPQLAVEHVVAFAVVPDFCPTSTEGQRAGWSERERGVGGEVRQGGKDANFIRKGGKKIKGKRG